MFSGEVSHEAYQGKQNAAFKARGRNGFREETAKKSQKHDSKREKIQENRQMDIRSEIKAPIICEGMTMTEVVNKLAMQYGWSQSVPNFFGKLKRNSLRYQEAVELADALGYNIVWQKRKRWSRCS